MSIYKIPLQENVLDASAERIDWTLNNFSRVCVSFSGGKDSTVMLHLVAQQARQLKRKIDVIFLDWEAQFSSTIQHVDTMRTLYRDVIHQFWWVALPLTTQNALSQFQPEWQCWEPGTNWVRQPPEDAITDYYLEHPSEKQLKAVLTSNGKISIKSAHKPVEQTSES